MSQSFSPTRTISIKRETFLNYSVLWCPICNKIYIRYSVNSSITSYVCKCASHLIKLNADHKIVEKALDEKGTEYLSKEDLVEILV